MPLIQITTKRRFQPKDKEWEDTDEQSMVAKLARALPGLLIAHKEHLHLDPDTPAVGVQVSIGEFNFRSINTPDVWVLIQFSETELTGPEMKESAAHVKEMLTNWFEVNEYVLPQNFACDCQWTPSHGFLSIDGEQKSW